MPDNTAPTIFGEQHVLCKAYGEHVLKDRTDMQVYYVLCPQFALDPDEDPPNPDALEKALIGYHQQQEELFSETEELLTVVTEGKMQVLHFKLIVSCESLGTITLNESIQLIVNGMVKAQTFDVFNKGPIVEAFADSFPNRTLKDLGELSYYDRIETVMKAYHALNPRDGLAAVTAACQRACPDTSFTMEVQRPEYIGEAYLAYLLDKWEERRDPQYIMGLANFISTGRYLTYLDDNKNAMNLWNQPSHIRAYDIFHTMMLAAAESNNGKEAQGHTPGRSRKKGAGGKPGTRSRGGRGPGDSKEGDDADSAVAV